MGKKEFGAASAAGALIFTGLKVLAPEILAELSPDTVQVVVDILKVISDTAPVIAWAGLGGIVGGAGNLTSGAQSEIRKHFKLDTGQKSDNDSWDIGS